jgi:hypothetical protein
VVDVENYTEADLVSTRLSFAFGRASRRRASPEQLRQVVDHDRYNVESMVQESRRRGIPVMLLSVPVNLKDWIPNVSVHRAELGDADLARFRAHVRQGLDALDGGHPALAVDAFTAATRIDDGYAEAHYLLGVAQHRLGRLDLARASYVRAPVEDAYRDDLPGRGARDALRVRAARADRGPNAGESGRAAGVNRAGARYARGYPLLPRPCYKRPGWTRRPGLAWVD